MAMRDIDDIRRANLRLLEISVGGTTEASKRCEMTPSQFANLRDGAKDSKTGKPRGMRKETARRIEVAFEKPSGWLDVDSADKTQPNITPTPIGAHSALPPTLAQALDVVAAQLNQLPDDQRELVAKHLQTLAWAPDSQRARETLLLTMASKEGGVPIERSIAGQLQEVSLSVESRDIYPVKTKI